MLVGLGVHGHPGDDRGRLGSVGGEQVYAGDFALSGAAEGLAVDRDVVPRWSASRCRRIKDRALGQGILVDLKPRT